MSNSSQSYPGNATGPPGSSASFTSFSSPGMSLSNPSQQSQQQQPQHLAPPPAFIPQNPPINSHQAGSASGQGEALRSAGGQAQGAVEGRPRQPRTLMKRRTIDYNNHIIRWMEVRAQWRGGRRRRLHIRPQPDHIINVLTAAPHPPIRGKGGHGCKTTSSCFDSFSHPPSYSMLPPPTYWIFPFPPCPYDLSIPP